MSGNDNNTNTNTGTILVLDDNATNLDAISVLIRKEGYRAVTRMSARDLSATLDSIDDLAAIFLDLEFPNDTGFKILDTLKRDARLTQIPVVAYSVHISELNEARDAGFHSFIGKPLNVERFSDQLRRILKGIPVWEVL